MSFNYFGTIPCFALGAQITTTLYFEFFFILAPAGDSNPVGPSFLTLRGKPIINLTLNKHKNKKNKKDKGEGLIVLHE